MDTSHIAVQQTAHPYPRAMVVLALLTAFAVPMVGLPLALMLRAREVDEGRRRFLARWAVLSLASAAFGLFQYLLWTT